MICVLGGRTPQRLIESNVLNGVCVGWTGPQRLIKSSVLNGVCVWGGQGLRLSMDSASSTVKHSCWVDGGVMTLVSSLLSSVFGTTGGLMFMKRPLLWLNCSI